MILTFEESSSSNRPKRKSPTPKLKRAIIEYWEVRISETDMGADWSEADTHCWRCGHKARLQVCHIVAHAQGGSNEPDNLVLLCTRCHAGAPSVIDPNFMWQWIAVTRADFYDTFWINRGLEVFRQMFKRDPNLKLIEAHYEKCRAEAKAELGLTDKLREKSTWEEWIILNEPLSEIYSLFFKKLIHHVSSLAKPEFHAGHYSVATNAFLLRTLEQLTLEDLERIFPSRQRQ